MSKPNLQQLQQKWYRKLEKEGFKDIETAHGVLRDAAYETLQDEYAEPPKGNHKRESSKIHKTSQQEYYRLAGQYLYDKPFPNKRYKEMWQMHAEGKSYKEIGLAFSMTKWQARYYICKLRTKFGL